ncbi:MAG: methyltransferase domain-containing protein [Gaiellaceae bacterium]
MRAGTTQKEGTADAWVQERLACPRDRAPLTVEGERLVCRDGHEYPFVDGIPVLVVDDVEPTQPGYWANPEQIDAVRAAEPPAIEGDRVDPYVAELIIGTHGNLYRHLAEGMDRYPIPSFPLPPGSGETLLDIGCNWGRWTLSAVRAGYAPIGIDPSFEAIAAARRIARQLGVEARYVVADARHLPFPDASFQVVFSYGVLQHFSKADVRVSLAEIARVVEPAGYTWVQMPNSLGVRNLYQLARRRFREGDHFEVRYWTPRELRSTWGGIVGPTQLSTDGFFTLNPQTSDLDLLPARFRALVRVSDGLKRASRRVGLLTNLADSVNVRARPR